MKKFTLKPLGDSCMKTVCKGGLFIGLLMTFCLSACSDDDDDAVTPIFPEKQNIICNSNDTREFTFTANTNWSLASSAIWCKFKADDMEEFVLSGTAGTQTVTLLVTDDNMQAGNVSIAKLELTMGGQTIVIGEVTRSKVDYELKIYDADGIDITEQGILKVGHRDFVRFDVKANFRFAATNLPGWVELEGGSLVGAVNQKVKGGLKIIENEVREKYPVQASEENVITFADEEGRSFKTFKVVYDGMTPGMIDITAPSTNRYGWTVSLDGKSFAQDGNANTYTNKLPFTIKTLNDDFEIVFIEKGNYNNSLYLMDSEYNEWMRCEGEKGNINLIVTPLDPAEGIKERVGYVLVLSRAEYESIKDDLEGTLIEGGDIVYKYQQEALLVQFTQKEIKKDETKQYFSAVDGTDYSTPIECTPYAEGDAEYFKEKYGVKGISEIKQPGAASTYVTVSFEIWDAKCYYLDNEADAPADIIDPAGTTMTVDTQKASGKDIFIIVTGETSDDKAMLIVRTSNAGGGEKEVVFKVSDNTGSSVACTSYSSNAFGNVGWIMSELGVDDLFEITEPLQSMNVTFAASNISSYTFYDAVELTELNLTDSSIADMGGNTLNVWLGDDTEINTSILLVIEGDDGKKHGLFIHVN